VPNQESSKFNFSYSLASYYKIYPKKTKPDFDDNTTEIFSPRTKLMCIKRSLQKPSYRLLIRFTYVHDYLLSQYRRHRRHINIGLRPLNGEIIRPAILRENVC
jgi:hypothetical protein